MHDCLYEQQQPDRYECLYSVEREYSCTLIAYNKSSATSRLLLFARSENGKYENDKLFRFPSRGNSHPNQSAFLQGSVSRRGLLTQHYCTDKRVQFLFTVLHSNNSKADLNAKQNSNLVFTELIH